MAQACIRTPPRHTPCGRGYGCAIRRAKAQKKPPAYAHSRIAGGKRPYRVA